MTRHKPVKAGALNQVEFHRCPCGFTLAKYNGRLHWIRSRNGMVEIRSAAELQRALATHCWHAGKAEKRQAVAG